MSEQIKMLSELNVEQKQEAVALFVEGFYSIFSKGVSKDKQILRELFKETFAPELVYVFLANDKAVGFLGLANNQQRSVCLKEETCKRLLGSFKGKMLYKQMGSMLHELTVSDEKEGYIDYLTTALEYRGRGIGSKLIQHVCRTLNYETYKLEVLSKNTNAKRLYEHLGFEVIKVKKNLLLTLSGMGSTILMELKAEQVESL